MTYVKINKLQVNFENKNNALSLTTFPCNIHTVSTTVFRTLTLCYPLGATIVGIAIHYVLDGTEFKFWWQKETSLSPYPSRLALSQS